MAHMIKKITQETIRIEKLSNSLHKNDHDFGTISLSGTKDSINPKKEKKISCTFVCQLY